MRHLQRKGSELELCFLLSAGGLWGCGVISEGVLAAEAWLRLAELMGADSSEPKTRLKGCWVGPRTEMEAPWSTTAREILRGVGVRGVRRVMHFRRTQMAETASYDPMLEQIYTHPDAELLASFATSLEPTRDQTEPYVEDLESYNERAHLALDAHELKALRAISQRMGRPLTETEAFGWAQIHSEHCRHKHFHARYTIDGAPQARSLFEWIKSTTAQHPGRVVSAYTDNVAFLEGPSLLQFAPRDASRSSCYMEQTRKGLISLKAETHNFPTTVEPFYGAGTGTGGEIRDRMAGGCGSLPLAGTAVYMTSYSRLDSKKLKPWEARIAARPWLYRPPSELLIKASDGASDYANKFGQPLICGSILTFEHTTRNGQVVAYDKVVMMAGGVGTAAAEDKAKLPPRKDDLLILLGGDNYRIGLGGGAVSSVATGHYGFAAEQQAIQRANPEMQKRVLDVVQALLEGKGHPIRSIHDHGAGGHLNCFAELLDGWGAELYVDALPMGDQTLSYRELLCNESQERMGLLIAPEGLAHIQKVASRMNCPLYVVGKVCVGGRLRCIDRRTGGTAVDMAMEDLLCELPKRHIAMGSLPFGAVVQPQRAARMASAEQIYAWAEAVMGLEGVACKDWLTSKVDRCVGGRVAMQPCCGPWQLPLNNLGVVKVDFGGRQGIATAIGHAPGAGLYSATAASRLSLAEALSNLVFAPLSHGLSGVSCSANWMWPQGKNEALRLYEAVQALSVYAAAMGINIPTGKDSLSMQQHYKDGQVVPAPGTLIVSAAAEVEDVERLVSPALDNLGRKGAWLYVPLGKGYGLGGSALSQVAMLDEPVAAEPYEGAVFAKAFGAVQALLKQGQLGAGHDIGGGGLLTTLLELCFANPALDMDLDFSPLLEGTGAVPSLEALLFSELPGWMLQVKDVALCLSTLSAAGVEHLLVGRATTSNHKAPTLRIRYGEQQLGFDVARYLKLWLAPSVAMDSRQRPRQLATARAEKLSKQPLWYRFPPSFKGVWPTAPATGIASARAAVLREKGVNSEREIAYALYRAGFQVKDIHMSDLCSGHHKLADIRLLVFAGGFAHADVFGAARGWAALFRHNKTAQATLNDFYARPDTLSIGICNGCQLMGELGLLGGEAAFHPRLLPNASGRFECRFVDLEIEENPSVFFASLAGLRLGAWAAHGEGRFHFPDPTRRAAYPIVARYGYADYPGNPNGSYEAVACLTNSNGRHTAIMPHIERALFPCNWAHYPEGRRIRDACSPWILPFVAARDWLAGR